MTTATADYLRLPLGDFLDAVAAAEPAPGGGAVSALAVSLGAALTEMAAGFSVPRWAGAAAVAREAQELRSRAAPLAQADAAAYREVLTALARPKSDPDRSAAVGFALSQAADVPLQMAETGARVVTLARQLEHDGNPNLRGDAVTARLVAAAGVRAACVLVEINLTDPADPRVQRAQGLAAAVREA